MDYLKECMGDLGNPPLDAMQRNFCVVCANRQCERSGMNQSSFDNRVKNWKSLLFDNVPRAEPGDERYVNITSKNFAHGGPVKPPPTSVFIPGVPTIARPAPPPARPAAFVEAEEQVPAPPEGALEPLDLEGVAAPAPVPERPVAAPGNTAFEQGIVLDGAPAGTAPQPRESPAQGQTFILEDD